MNQPKHTCFSYNHSLPEYAPNMVDIKEAFLTRKTVAFNYEQRNRAQGQTNPSKQTSTSYNHYMIKI